MYKKMVCAMSVNITTESLNQWLSVSSLAAVIVGVPPEVALGALAGAVIFVTSAVEYPIRRRVFLSMLSFLCGLLFYKPAASILIGIASLIPTITQDSFEKGIVFCWRIRISNCRSANWYLALSPFR